MVQATLANQPAILTAPDGSPLVALIDYKLYLLLKETISAWYAAQANPATVELLRLYHQAMAEIEQNPSQLVTNEELERDIQAKLNHVGH